LDAGLLHATETTVTGRTIGAEASAARETPGQKVIRALADPIARHGGMAILRGNLAPEGCVAKVAGHGEEVFRGTARVFARGEAAEAVLHVGRVGEVRAPRLLGVGWRCHRVRPQRGSARPSSSSSGRSRSRS